MAGFSNVAYIFTPFIVYEHDENDWTPGEIGKKSGEFSWKPSFKLASQKCRLDLIQDKVVLFSHVAINRMTPGYLSMAKSQQY